MRRLQTYAEENRLGAIRIRMADGSLKRVPMHSIFDSSVLTSPVLFKKSVMLSKWKKAECTLNLQTHIISWESKELSEKVFLSPGTEIKKEKFKREKTKIDDKEYEMNKFVITVKGQGSKD